MVWFALCAGYTPCWCALCAALTFSQTRWASRVGTAGVSLSIYLLVSFKGLFSLTLRKHIKMQVTNIMYNAWVILWRTGAMRTESPSLCNRTYCCLRNNTSCGLVTPFHDMTIIINIRDRQIYQYNRYTIVSRRPFVYWRSLVKLFRRYECR